jgi:hypothetical protein
VQEEMSRVLGDERLQFRAGDSVGWAPACDIHQDGEEIVVRAELAGVHGRWGRPLLATPTTPARSLGGNGT